jgi:GNAT superfamily N-acetyltransferase
VIATTGSAHLTLTADDPTGPVARQLIDQLCTELSIRYGTPPSPFSPSEAAAPRTVFLVARLNQEPVGCGAIRRIDDATAEVKRMYVAPAGRRRGIARKVLVELERRAGEFGYRTIRLETGIGQPEAMALYEACGYHRIPAYGLYVGNPNSVCFEKDLNPESGDRVLEGTGCCESLRKADDGTCG